MKLLLVGIFLFCCIAAGYSSGLKARQIEKVESLTKELIQSPSKPPNRSLAFALSVVSDEKLRSSGARASGPSTIESALDKVQLSPHEIDLWEALNPKVNTQTNSESIFRIRRALIANNHSNEIPGTDLFLKNLFNDFKNNPTASLNDLKTGLDQLPSSGFPIERATLLNMMDTVAGPSSEVKSQALKELTLNSIPARPDPTQAQTEEELNSALSTTPDMVLPIASHLVFLKNTTDPNEALEGTIQGILSQPDHGIQISLASQFIIQYPDLSTQLNSELIQRGIQLSLEGVK